MHPLSRGIPPPDPQDQPATLRDLHTLLRALKRELLTEIKMLVRDQPKPSTKKWLKNKDVMALLDVKRATLQALRDDGTLPYSRIGRNFYYDPEDIEAEIKRRKTLGRYHATGKLRSL
jgi:hypothetical protein